MRNSAVSSAGIDSNQKPARPMLMISTSASLIQRTSRALSMRSASCPASAENRK